MRGEDRRLREDGRLFSRVANTQTREAMVVAIGCDPFTSTFNGECSKECIGHEITSHVGGLAETAEDVPVTGAWIDDCAVGLFT